MLDVTENPTLIFTTSSCPDTTLDLWRERGAEIFVAPSGAGNRGVHLETVLEELGKRGSMQLMVEGGGEIQGAFLGLGLVDELRLYYGPKLIGSTGKSWAQAQMTRTITDAKEMKLVGVRGLGEDFCATYRRIPAKSRSA